MVRIVIFLVVTHFCNFIGIVLFYTYVVYQYRKGELITPILNYEEALMFAARASILCNLNHDNVCNKNTRPGEKREREGIIWGGENRVSPLGKRGKG